MRKDDVVKNICTELKASGDISNFAYDHFKANKEIDLPFVVYRRVAPDTFSADGVTYHRGSNVDLELYASDADEMAELMDTVEAALDTAELFYRITADTVYLDSEEMYETLYEL